MLPDTGRDGGLIVAEKIRSLIAESPFASEAGPVAVTASFGVASTAASGPDLGTGTEALIAASDACLYQSKQDGRNRITSIELGLELPPKSCDATAQLHLTEHI